MTNGQSLNEISFDDAYNNIKADYLASLRTRSQELSQILLKLKEGDADGFKEIFRIIHSFVGSGTSFGIPEISETASEIDLLIKQSTPEAMAKQGLDAHAKKLIEDFANLILKISESAISSNNVVDPSELSTIGSLVNTPDGEKNFYILVSTFESRQRLEGIFQGLGIKFLMFDDINEFCKAISKIKPFAIIIEPHQQSNDLRQCAESLKQYSRLLAPIPIMVLNSEDSVEFKLKAVQNGAQYFFKVPLDIGQFTRTLQNILDFQSQAPFRILIVDDDAKVSEFHANILRSVGMTVKCSGEPQQVTALIQSFKPELILMDVYMPDMSGLELALIIRLDEASSQIPIVFLSSEARFDRQLMAKNMAGDDFLMKPIEPRHLAASVFARVNRSRKVLFLHEKLHSTIESLQGARSEALAASKHKTDFVANMSHELRTPLNGVIGMAQVLSETKLDAEQTEYLRMLTQSGESLLSLINDVLDFSKIEAGKVDFESVEFSLVEVAEKCIDLFWHNLAARNIFLGLRADPRLMNRVMGDPLRFRQVLTNFVGNAAKFTEQGSIVIEMLITDATVERVIVKTSVRDTGIGMSKAQLNKLFSAFTQAEASTSRRFGGTGLGLTISKSLIEGMNGQVFVESELGKGSTFSFTASFALNKGTGLGDQLKVKESCLLAGISGDRYWLEQMYWLSQTIGANFIGAYPRKGAEAIFEANMVADQLSLVIIDAKADSESTIAWVREAGARFGMSMGKVALCLEPKELNYYKSQWPGVLLSSITNFQQNAKALISYLNEARPNKLKAKNNKPLNQPPVESKVIAPAPVPVPTKTKDTQLLTVGDPPRPPRILLAEDNPVNQVLALNFLKRLGCETDLVADGAKAVSSAKSNHYDAILMDCQMPVTDGYQATTMIRALESSGTRVPIIAMTAHAFSMNKDQCIASGMDAHLSKPIRIDDLRKTLAEFLESPKIQISKVSLAKELVGKNESSLPIALPTPAALKVEVQESANGPTAAAVLACALPSATVDQEFWESMKRDLAGAPETLSEMVSLFVAALPGEIERLRTAIKAQDGKAIVFQLHRMRGTAISVGASRIIERCSKLEELPKGEHLKIPESLCEELHQEFDKAVLELKTVVPSVKVPDTTNSAAA